MDAFLFVFFLVFVGIVTLNGIILFQLTTKGESKKEYIKMKSLAETMQLTIGLLVIDSISYAFDISKYEDGYQSLNPIYLLFILSVFFLASLLRNQRKCGVKNKKNRKRKR